MWRRYGDIVICVVPYRRPMAALETFQKQLGVQGFYTPENAQLDPQNIYTIDPKGSRIVGTLPIIFRLFAVQLHGGASNFWMQVITATGHLFSKPLTAF